MVIEGKASNTGKCGYAEKHDRYIFETLRMIDSACDRFWFSTPERRKVNTSYRASNWFLAQADARNGKTK